MKGLIDPGANAPVIQAQDWPTEVPLVPTSRTLTRGGGQDSPLQNKFAVVCADMEGHRAITRPFVPNIPVSLWGRDL